MSFYPGIDFDLFWDWTNTENRPKTVGNAFRVGKDSEGPCARLVNETFDERIEGLEAEQREAGFRDSGLDFRCLEAIAPGV